MLLITWLDGDKFVEVVVWQLGQGICTWRSANEGISCSPRTLNLHRSPLLFLICNHSNFASHLSLYRFLPFIRILAL